MKVVDFQELPFRLSGYAGLLQSGEEVFLTDCGEVVAEHRQLQSAFACQQAPSAR